VHQVPKAAYQTVEPEQGYLNNLGRSQERH